jgi:hypothetical protein
MTAPWNGHGFPTQTTSLPPARCVVVQVSGPDHLKVRLQLKMQKNNKGGGGPVESGNVSIEQVSDVCVGNCSVCNLHMATAHRPSPTAGGLRGYNMLSSIDSSINSG